MLTLTKHWFTLVVVLMVVLLDQISKYLIVVNSFSYILNAGIAFSIPLGNLISFIVGILIVGVLFFYGDKLFSMDDKRTSVLLGLVMGGAIGNLIDRIRLGAVIDFIKLPYWPAFNIADSAIVIGIVFVLLKSLRENRK